MANLISDRRKFLQIGAGTAGAVLVGNPFTKALAAVCGVTPVQTAGPFFPGEAKFIQDNDLTQINSLAQVAKGQIIYITGRVVDQACNPVAAAQVEIWQACESGRYNHAADTNPAELDPNFKYWGETITDKSGAYSFKSILPGAYPADVGWIRPPHVHFKVSKLGYKELITQLYFKGNDLNKDDLILQAIPEGERDSVVVDFQPTVGDSQTLTGSFDITLLSVNRRVSSPI